MDEGNRVRVIGMIHLDTLLGYPQHTSMADVIEHAVQDGRALITGGVNGIRL
jgi:predicted TIM-barrel enzyme